MTCEDRVAGCLLGGAIGDCLGAPYEGRTLPFAFALPEVWRTTDDTQLTLATARAVAREGRADPACIATEYVSEFRARRLTGLGASTYKALSDLAAGAHWALAGRRGEMAAGNGAAMRVAPLAFVLNVEVDSERRILRDICRITHHSDEAYAAALAVVAAIARPGGSLDEVAATLPDSLTRDRLRRCAELPPTASIQQVANITGTSGHAAESVPLAISSAWLAARIPFEQLIESVVEQGGDTDTNASITGQVVGARLGQS